MQTVVILICTFDRPHYLGELLTALAQEVSSSPCKTIAVVVVDNGTQNVGKLVETFQSSLPIEYVYLPGSGLVGARNASLRIGLRHEPDYLVFIDDDEVPERGWLSNLLSTMTSSDADFAVGPVKPKFSESPPPWAPDFFTKSGEAFCTSNLIVREAVVPRDEIHWFQQRFNSTGGEDGEFLRRLASSGAKHTVAHSALLMEHIPSERVTAQYLWRRGFRDGLVVSKSEYHKTAEVLVLAGKKLCFGLNHLFWTVTKRDRMYRAIDDLSLACGLVVGTLGFSCKFY